MRIDRYQMPDDENETRRYQREMEDAEAMPPPGTKMVTPASFPQVTQPRLPLRRRLIGGCAPFATLGHGHPPGPDSAGSQLVLLEASTESGLARLVEPSTHRFAKNVGDFAPYHVLPLIPRADEFQDHSVTGMRNRVSRSSSRHDILMFG